MDSRIDILKDIHPSKFIERELRKQNISSDGAGEGNRYPCQRINMIITGTCTMTAEEASKLEDGLMVFLQPYTNIII